MLVKLTLGVSWEQLFNGYLVATEELKSFIFTAFTQQNTKVSENSSSVNFEVIFWSKLNHKKLMLRD